MSTKAETEWRNEICFVLKLIVQGTIKMKTWTIMILIAMFIILHQINGFIGRLKGKKYQIFVVLENIFLGGSSLFSRDTFLTPRRKCSRQPKNTVKIKTMLSNGSRISQTGGCHQKVETTTFLFWPFSLNKCMKKIEPRRAFSETTPPPPDPRMSCDNWLLFCSQTRQSRFDEIVTVCNWDMTLKPWTHPQIWSVKGTWERWGGEQIGRTRATMCRGKGGGVDRSPLATCRRLNITYTTKQYKQPSFNENL